MSKFMVRARVNGVPIQHVIRATDVLAAAEKYKRAHSKAEVSDMTAKKLRNT